jgi:invasion protein IalB
VVATNAVGDSLPSAESNSVTPLPPPDAPNSPANVVAVASGGSASVSWTAPNDKGFPITRYTVTANPSGRQATSTEPDAVVSGLLNGQSYTFTVTATNQGGTSLPSTPSNAVIPVGPPDPPTGVFAAVGPSSANVSWNAPNDGGKPITGYTITANPGGSVVKTIGTSAVVNGLTNGTSYTFTVYATNDLGDGDSSLPSNPVTPAIAPDVPTNVVALPGNLAVTLTWTAPNDNGAPIIGYSVVTSPGGATTNASASGVTIGNLTNGTAYTFTVTATNAVGTSVASAASAPVTPGPCVQTTYVVTNPGTGYSFSGVLGVNPQIVICRGQTYTFHLQNVNGHPFAVLNNQFQFHSGVTNNGSEGTVDIVWSVPSDEPIGSRYTCLIHPPMTNTFDLR